MEVERFSFIKKENKIVKHKKTPSLV